MMQKTDLSKLAFQLVDSIRSIRQNYAGGPWK